MRKLLFSEPWMQALPYLYVDAGETEEFLGKPEVIAVVLVVIDLLGQDQL